MNVFILAGYGVFLALIFVINLLYFFQIFRYRLPNDASLPVLIIYVLAMLILVVGTDILLR